MKSRTHVSNLVGPLYTQMADRIRQEIDKGTFGATGLLPSEIELARQYKVSVGTIRRALLELRSQRLITRSRGRGTFVIPNARRKGVYRFGWLQYRNRPVDVEPVGSGAVPDFATNEEAGVLELQEGDRIVRCLQKALLDGAVVLVHHYVLPSSDLPGMTVSPTPANGAACQHLLKDLEASIAFVEDSVLISEAPRDIADSLGTSESELVFLLNRTAFDRNARPILWRRSWMRLAGAEYVANPILV